MNRVEVRPAPEEEALLVLQSMFNALARQFEGIQTCRTGGVSRPAAAANLRWLQQAAGLPQTGCLDLASWTALAHIYEVFVVRDAARTPAFSGGWG